MARNVTKIVALCASVLIVLFAIACSAQPTQEGTKPATETSQAPAPADSQQQAAPSEPAAAPAEGTAPAAPSQEQAPAPAQGQQEPNQQ